MDGDRITQQSIARARVARAASRGLTATQVMLAIQEVELLAETEGKVTPTRRIDGPSFALGAAQAVLWMIGQRDQTPTAWLASAREKGIAR